MTLIEKVKEYRDMYRAQHPDKIAAATVFAPVPKYDVFGNKIEEPMVGTIDQLIQKKDKETYQKQMDSWVFYRCLSDGEDYDSLVGMIGNPGDMMPCDGDLHQCVLFCPEYRDCRYKKENPPKTLEQMLQEQEKTEEPEKPKEKFIKEGDISPAVAGSAVTITQTSKKKRKKKK